MPVVARRGWQVTLWVLISLAAGAVASTVMALLALKFYVSIAHPYAVFLLLALGVFVLSWILTGKQGRFRFALPIISVISFSLGFWG